MGKIFKPAHEEPGNFRLNYILLPYGEFYQKTKEFLEASAGDTLRFYNGPDVRIESVMLIACDKTCDFLCRMRYGITWDKAFAKWLSYARLEGHGKDILSRAKCILVVYENKS
jgi:hypothetical protein